MKLRLVFFALVTWSSLAFAADSSLLSELDPQQIAQLNNGQIVIVSKDMGGGSWPALKLYRKVNAAPSVIWNIFTDYQNAPNYIPNMLNAEVIGRPQPNVIDVRYTVRVPVLQKISYTVRNYFSQNGDNYTVRWTLLSSPLAKKSDGALRVQPVQGQPNQSIFCYENQVVPAVPLVGGLKDQALQEAMTTVKALAMEAERRAAASPPASASASASPGQKR